MVRGVLLIWFCAFGQARVSINTAGGVLAAWRDGGGIAVNMGVPRFGWDAIPLRS